MIASYSRRDFLKISSAFIATGITAISCQRTQRLNIIYINVDDLGWRDAGFMGIDLYPTILELTGSARIKGKILDGISIVPLLKQDDTLPLRPLYWHFPIYLQGGDAEPRDSVFRTRPGSVIRYGDWKLHEYFDDGSLELYNLKEDIGETINLV